MTAYPVEEFKRDFDSLVRRSFKKWKAGEAVHREMTMVRMSAAAFACHGNIPKADWFSDCLNPESAAFEGFSKISGSLAGTPGQGRMVDITAAGSWLNAAIHYTALKLLSVARSPSWFTLSEGLALKLLTTEIKGALAKDVKAPFEGFMIEMPPGLLWWDHDDTGRHEVSAVSVVEGTAPEVPAYDPGLEGGRRLLVMCFCEPNEKSTDPADDNLAYFTVPLFDEDEKVEDLFKIDKEVIADIENEALNGGEVRGRFGGMDMTGNHLRDLFRRFVVNVLLYLNSPDADVIHVGTEKAKKIKKKKAKNKKARQKIKKHAQEARAERNWLVGSRVSVDPRLKRAVSEGRRDAGGKLRFKSLVRGHWRNQAHGPNRSLRKMIWISPHVRGASLEGPLLGHDYQVE